MKGVVTAGLVILNLAAGTQPPYSKYELMVTYSSLP